MKSTVRFVRKPFALSVVLGTVLFGGVCFARMAQAVPGSDRGAFLVTAFHGADYLRSSFESAGRHFVTIRITGATAGTNGRVTVDFRVENKAGAPVPGIKDAHFNIAKLSAPSDGEAFDRWVPYIYRLQTVTDVPGSDWPNPSGTSAYQGYREAAAEGRFADFGDGRYRYEFRTNLTSARAGTRAIPYERNLTHRIAVMLGGQSGQSGDAVYDFVPDGSRVTRSRDIVQTAMCQSCHGEFGLPGHDRERFQLTTCVTCHNPGQVDPHSGESLDMNVMVHKIHAGAHLDSIPGKDGIVFNNPTTPVDESADNGRYAIWGDGNQKHTWWNIEYPAVVANCTKCHQGPGAQVDNWKTVPSIAACGSCHDDVNFRTGVNHEAATNDTGCVKCHAPAGNKDAVVDSHEWTTKDPRNIPEYTVDLSVSRPANGTHFVAGEAPVVKLVFNEDGKPIDHTTVIEDTNRDEGCLASGCPPSDGMFSHAYFFVHGPRANRNPVLTTAARAVVKSSATGPFDLSAKGAGLALKIDSGQEVRTRLSAASGAITVAVTEGTWRDVAAATPAEIVAWLNRNRGFAARAIAYIESGSVAIRSRNLGTFYSVKLEPGPVTDVVFGGDTSVHVLGSNFPFNNLVKFQDSSRNDPKARWEKDAITYQLDPVDDLQPGTYVASVQISGRGRVTDTNYKTPSVAKVTFQVGTPTDELPAAGNCAMCHRGPQGTGFVLDYLRHNKILDDTAVDQCGACHDGQSQDVSGEWVGGLQNAKRVHAVHFGSSLNYPLATVGYRSPGIDSIPGRNWNITFPQDVRNCETCHPAGTTSGTWKTAAARLPCSGCHDSQAAQAHMRLQTFDPTPATPWNGDELESCKVCH